jgi:hypothetical protein
VFGFDKGYWRELLRDKPGQRFRAQFRRMRERGGPRLARMIAAVGLIATGLVLLFVPGPGSLLIVVGAALLAEGSYVVARRLDRVEVRAREVLTAVRRKLHRG